MSLSKQEKIVKLQEYLKNIKLDASVMSRTLGMATTSVSPQVMTNASKKLLDVFARKVDADDRDNVVFSKFLSTEDYLKEHIEHDAGKIQFKAKSKLRQKRNLSWLHAGFFTPQVKSVFVGNSLSQNIEGVNPMEQYMLAHKVTKMGMGGIGCHSEDTEVMTRTGWKFWPEVTMSDELAVVIDGQLDFKKPTALHSGRYVGELLEFDNFYVNCLVTPTHRMFAANPRYNRHTKVRSFSEFSLRPAEEAYESRWKHKLAFEAYRGGENPGKVEISPAPCTGKNNKATQIKESVLFDAVPWAALLGYYLADGSYSFNEQRVEYRVEIGKSLAANPDEVTIIEETLKELGITHRYDQGRRFVINGKHFAYYFKQFGKSRDKFVPEWIMGGSLEVREAFFNAITRMDCSGKLACGGSLYESASRTLRDQVAQLAVMRGMHVNYSETRYFKAKLNNRKEVMLAGKACYKKVPYNGLVYCASVPGELLLTRRHGKCVWTGNSTEAIPDSSREVNESQFGLLDPIQTVEATTIGVVNFFAHNVRKGADGKLYREVIDNSTGKPVWIDHQEFLSSTIDVPEH